MNNLKCTKVHPRYEWKNKKLGNRHNKSIKAGCYNTLNSKPESTKNASDGE